MTSEESAAFGIIGLFFATKNNTKNREHAKPAVIHAFKLLTNHAFALTPVQSVNAVFDKYVELAQEKEKPKPAPKQHATVTKETPNP